MDCIVHGVTKSWTQLSNFHFTWGAFGYGRVKVSVTQSSDSATPWTVALQAPLFMGFSRQEYWSGLPFPSPGDFLYPGTEPMSPALQAESLPSEPSGGLQWNTHVQRLLDLGWPGHWDRTLWSQGRQGCRNLQVTTWEGAFGCNCPEHHSIVCCAATGWRSDHTLRVISASTLTCGRLQVRMFEVGLSPDIHQETALAHSWRVEQCLCCCRQGFVCSLTVLSLGGQVAVKTSSVSRALHQVLRSWWEKKWRTQPLLLKSAHLCLLGQQRA